MISSRSVRCLLWLFTAYLCGCASTDRTTNTTSATSDTIWSARGKVGVRSPKGNKSAFFKWRNNGEHYQIQLFGPLGQGRVYIDKNDDGVTFRRGQQIVVADSSDALLERTTGIKIPVSMLQSWIRGQPASDARFSGVERDDSERLSQFRQAGWLVRITRYDEQSPTLPSKLILKYADYTLIVSIKSWQSEPI